MTEAETARWCLTVDDCGYQVIAVPMDLESRIAAALRAERERCAVIAESMGATATAGMIREQA